jgi:hypothetical protein
MADWHGEVKHIQTSRRWTFRTLDELIGFLRWRTEDPNVLGRQTVILPPTRATHMTSARRQFQPLTATVSKHEKDQHQVCWLSFALAWRRGNSSGDNLSSAVRPRNDRSPRSR